MHWLADPNLSFHTIISLKIKGFSYWIFGDIGLIVEHFKIIFFGPQLFHFEEANVRKLYKILNI